MCNLIGHAVRQALTRRGDIAGEQPYRYERQLESDFPYPPAFRSYNRLCEPVAVRVVHWARSPILTPQGVWSGPARPNGADIFAARLSDSDCASHQSR